MSKEDLEQELARLRAEIAELSAARKEPPQTPKTPEPSPETTPAVAAPVAGAAPDGGTPEAAETEHPQLNELLELLEAEIKDLPTITCLIVFSLGILMGRFLR
jgi:hypothetical protein